jgi:hypothetical protein
MYALYSFQDSEQFEGDFVAYEAWEIIVTFFIAKKVTKKSSAPKNSHFRSGYSLISCFAFTLRGVSKSFFLQLLVTNQSLDNA